MSIPVFGSGLERLSVLPDAINWKGDWIIGEQYYKNDVVVDPSGGSYILNVTSSAAGFDPALDPAWSELSGIATGVTSLRDGTGISITGAPDVTVNNEGIIEVFDGDNITIDFTDPQKPKISANVITRLIAGNGIRVYGLPNPIVENTGVVSLVGDDGSGILTNGVNDVDVANDGIIILQQGPGTTVTEGQNPTLSLNGVVKVTAGGEIFFNGDDRKNNPIVNILAGQLTLMFDSTSTDLNTDPFPIPPADATGPTPIYGTATLPITLADGLFANLLANGDPMAVNPVVLLDFSSWSILFDGTGPTSGISIVKRTVNITFADNSVPGNPLYYTLAGVTVNLFSPPVLPYVGSFGQTAFDINDARSSGLRTIDTIIFSNPFFCYIQILSAGGVWGVYYPNGLQ